MNKERQKLQQKVFECIDLCWEQNLEHELSLLSMVAGCLLTDDTPDDDQIISDYMADKEIEEKIRLENNLDDEGEQLGFDPDIHL